MNLRPLGPNRWEIENRETPGHEGHAKPHLGFRERLSGARPEPPVKVDRPVRDSPGSICSSSGRESSRREFSSHPRQPTTLTPPVSAPLALSRYPREQTQRSERAQIGHSSAVTGSSDLGVLSAPPLRFPPSRLARIPASVSVRPFYFPATSFSNLGFLRKGSKLGSILSQAGER